MTPVQSAPMVTLDVDVRVECGEIAVVITESIESATVVASEPNQAVEVVELVGEAEISALSEDGDVEASGPSGRDLGASGNGEASSNVIGLISDGKRVLVPIIPPVHGLDDPTGERHRHLLVALADGRRFELGHPLLKIRAAIAAEVSRLRGGRLECEPAKRQAKCGCDGDAAGCFCQSPKHVHLHLP